MSFQLLCKQDEAHDDSIWSVAWCSNSLDGIEYILTGGADGVVKSWKWLDNKRIVEDNKMMGHNLGVVGITAHDNKVASVGLDCTIRLWNVQEGTEIKCIDGGPADAWSIAFSPDGNKLATGANEGKVRIFDARDPECSELEVLNAQGKFALSLAFSSDNELLAVGGMDGHIKIFSNQNYQLLHTIEGHAMPIRSITFSPDSQFMMSASDDGHIKVYDAKHANLVGTLSGHSGWVLSVCFGPDNHAVSCSSDKTVKIWNVGTRQCINTFTQHTDQVWGAKYSKDGTKVVSAGDDCSIHVYDCV